MKKLPDLKMQNSDGGTNLGQAKNMNFSSDSEDPKNVRVYTNFYHLNPNLFCRNNYP